MEYGSESDLCLDFSDDDGFSVVLVDNCLCVFFYGFKFFWNIVNRDVVWVWVGELGYVFEYFKFFFFR